MSTSPASTALGPAASPPAATRRRTAQWVALLCLFWAAIYAISLARPALLDDADTIHAEAARNMLLRHDPVTLYIDLGVNPPAPGVRYLEKPPLPYWLVAISYQLFGVSEWSTRLPLALCVLALALYLLHLGGQVYGGEAGFYAGLVILTAFGVYLFTRFFIPDVLVGLWLAVSFGFFLRTLPPAPAAPPSRPAPRLACWGLAAAAALNVLTKGLIGVVFPAGVIFLYLLLTGNLRHLLRLRLLSSSMVFLALAAPWHVAAALANPAAGEARGFLWFYFVNEHFKRFLGTRYPRDYDTVPLALFWGLLLIWMLPWTAFLPQALAQIRAAKIRPPQSWLRLRQSATALAPAARAHLLFLLWALVIYLFFSFSTRQEYYILPALPALALMIGAWLGRESAAAGNTAASGAPEGASRKLLRTGRISAAALALFGLAAAIVCFTLALESKALPPGVDIAALLAQHPQDYALSMGHFLDLTPQALGAFRGPLLGAGSSLLLGTFLCWWWRRRRARPPRLLAANLALAAAMVGMLYCAHLAFITFNPALSSKQLALALKRQYRPGDVIVINGNLENASSLPFYSGIQAHVLGPQSNLWYGSLFPDAPRIFETPDSLRRLWDSRTRVFLWSETGDLPALRSPQYSVAQSGGKIILSNQPDR